MAELQAKTFLSFRLNDRWLHPLLGKGSLGQMRKYRGRKIADTNLPKKACCYPKRLRGSDHLPREEEIKKEVSPKEMPRLSEIFLDIEL